MRRAAKCARGRSKGHWIASPGRRIVPPGRVERGICPRGNSISPVRERTHSLCRRRITVILWCQWCHHSITRISRITVMPSHELLLFLVSSSPSPLLNNCLGSKQTNIQKNQTNKLSRWHFIVSCDYFAWAFVCFDYDLSQGLWCTSFYRAYFKSYYEHIPLWTKKTWKYKYEIEFNRKQSGIGWLPFNLATEWVSLAASWEHKQNIALKLCQQRDLIWNIFFALWWI